MQGLKTAAYSLILIAISTTTTLTAQSPAHSPSPPPFTPAPMTLPAPLAPAPLMMPEPPSMGGGGAPSPGLDCMPYLYNLTDCLGYVMIGSNDTKPDQKCCQELGSLVDTQPLCLCQLLGNPDKTGFSIDISKALKLPTVCNVTTPPVSLCAALGYPVPGGPSGAPGPGPGPGPSPAGATFTVPTVAPSPSEATSDESQSGSVSPGGVALAGASNLFISNLNFFIGIAFLNVVLRY